MQRPETDVLATMRKQVESLIRESYSTVEQFCWENDLNKATLSHFLRGKKDFRASTLAKIAAALDRRLVIRLDPKRLRRSART